MFFGRLSRNPDWMQQMLALSDEQRTEIAEVSAKYAQLKQLIFIRWDMVMYDFEKQLYANPDQDLNSLWWRLVEKYQFIKKPAGRTGPDWAAKIHLSQSPAYYHNYELGELMASQLQHYIAKNILKQESIKEVCFANKPEVGTYLKEKVFAPGASLRWDALIKEATGEPLSAKFFAEEYVK